MLRRQLLIASLAFAAAACAQSPGASPVALPRDVSEGEALPTVVLDRLDSPAVALTEYAHGRVMVVDLWASWCEACKATSAQVERLAQRYEQTDLLVVGVNIGERADLVRSYLGDARTLPTFLDPDFAFADALGARELPAVLVVDRSGKVVRHTKSLDADGLDLIRSLLEAS